MCSGHTHGFGGFEDRGSDGAKADIGVAKDWEEGVENQGDYGGAASDAPDEGDGD